MKIPAALLAKAIANVREGITISDASLPDNPLIYVNDAFVTMTGYTLEESLHSNCRYLQGEGTSAGSVDLIRTALRNQKPSVNRPLPGHC